MKKIILTALAVATCGLAASAQKQHTAAADLARRLQIIEDQLALKELVDTFSVLADVKETDAQTLLFTEDAELNSYADGKLVSTLRGREAIGKAFANYLANFETVYHINGQQTVHLDGDSATGIAYCDVTLVGMQNGVKTATRRATRYQDTYVRRDGRWLIAKRNTYFLWTETKPVNH